MEQNIEFVNLYIQKQKNYIEDLVGKLLVLETKATMLESRIVALEQENASLQENQNPKQKSIINEPSE